MKYYIDKDDLLSQIDNLIKYVKEHNDTLNAHYSVLEAYNTITCADTISVITCKECIHYDKDNLFCDYHISGMNDTDFCSKGRLS